MLLKKSLCLLVLFMIILGGMSLSVVAEHPTPDDPMTLDVGHILSPESIEHQSMLRYKELVEERTDGAIKIEVFPAEQLGTATDQIENIKNGIQAMHIAGFSFFETYSERLKLTSVPFLYRGGTETYSKWLDEIVRTKVVPKLIEKANINIISLGSIWLRSPFTCMVSRKPVYTPEDLKSIKLRVYAAETVQEAWRTLGANISVIDYGEVYLALQYGTVDALDTPINLIYPQKFTEVAKYVTETRAYPVSNALFVNNDIWNKLSAEQQQILQDCAVEAGDWQTKEVYDTIEPMIEKMIDEHNIAYIRVNREPFVKLTQEEVVPNLIEKGIIKEEYFEEIFSCQPEE